MALSADNGSAIAVLGRPDMEDLMLLPHNEAMLSPAAGAAPFCGLLSRPWQCSSHHSGHSEVDSWCQQGPPPAGDRAAVAVVHAAACQKLEPSPMQ